MGGVLSCLTLLPSLSGRSLLSHSSLSHSFSLAPRRSAPDRPLRQWKPLSLLLFGGVAERDQGLGMPTVRQVERIPHQIGKRTGARTSSRRPSRIGALPAADSGRPGPCFGPPSAIQPPGGAGPGSRPSLPQKRRPPPAPARPVMRAWLMRTRRSTNAASTPSALKSARQRAPMRSLNSCLAVSVVTTQKAPGLAVVGRRRPDCSRQQFFQQRPRDRVRTVAPDRPPPADKLPKPVDVDLGRPIQLPATVGVVADQARCHTLLFLHGTEL